MRKLFLIAALMGGGALALFLTSTAEQLLVMDGDARGRIVIAESPPRSVVLAAAELQAYLQRISGAELEIASAPAPDDEFTVYVGRSRHTDALGIDTAGLDFGAYRMVSGDGWLALIGKDDDFELPHPYTLQPASSHPDTVRMLEEWDAITGSTFDNPIGGPGLRRQYNRDLDLWAYDGRGSLNAVYAFLRKLGVRWYMSGELGEIVPSIATIAVAPVDQTAKPDFAWRQMAFARFNATPVDDVLWYLRQGFNHDDVVGHYSHGLREVMRRPELEAAHPEYYALIGGERHIGREQKNMPCLSSEGLEAETVRFARALFDTYDVPMVSVMPQDGFRFCECELCQGKDTPERGPLGVHSDYVWGFVERVARQLHASHPDKIVTCGAYGSYTLPPQRIDSFSPNVAALFVHGRGKRFHLPAADDLELLNGLPITHPASWSGEQLEQLRGMWLEKMHNPILNWEHYVFTHRGTFTPVFFPRAIAAGLASLRGDAFGEFVEVAFGPFPERGMSLHEPGFNHLNVYVTGRCYWDAELNVDELLAEYYTLFYGPAAEQMAAFVDFCEIYWPRFLNEPELSANALDLFDQAVAAADGDSIYAHRLQLLADYLQPLRFHLAQAQSGREGVPQWPLLAPDNVKITLDGRLDEGVWQTVRGVALRDISNGQPATPATTVTLFWRGDRLGGELWVGIRCEEPDMQGLLSTASGEGDPRLFDGDFVSVLIETQGHSFYEIAVNAAGATIDVDHQGGQRNFDWKSLADVATYVGADFWSAEIRIPIPGADTLGDPLHELAGRRPTLAFPWFINVGRQRSRDGDVSISAWSIGDTGNFYEPRHFGRLGARR